jgi:hypothetical protein
MSTYFSVYLKPGNIIQFLSRSSGRTIQIIVSKTTNELICDAIGGTGSYYPNAQWLVVCTPNGRYYFHNNYNYLAIKNGKIIIIPSSINEKPPNEAEFRVQDVLGSAQAIYLESVHMPGYFLSFDDEGEPNVDIKLKTKERFAQFELHLVSFERNDEFLFLERFCLFKIAYGPGIQPEADDKAIETSQELAPPSYWAATAGPNNESQTGSHSNSKSS